jgi:AcrR family transcriptional regulator
MPQGSQEHMRASPRIRPWLNIERTATEAYGRKMHLYVLAAPVFEAHGYRGATIKALAHACHLSPASLYHYFGSKAEMATYPLTGPAIDWDNAWVEPDVDPLVQLGVMLEMAVSMYPIWALALRLHEEIHGGPDPRVRAAGWGQGEAVFGRLIFAAAPDMERHDAEALARDVLASLAGTAQTSLDEDLMTAQLERMRQILRAGLVPEHVAADRFEAAMDAWRIEEPATSE